jgi:hypothetical protein
MKAVHKQVQRYLAATAEKVVVATQVNRKSSLTRLSGDVVKRISP